MVSVNVVVDGTIFSKFCEINTSDGDSSLCL